MRESDRELRWWDIAHSGTCYAQSNTTTIAPVHLIRGASEILVWIHTHAASIDNNPTPIWMAILWKINGVEFAFGYRRLIASLLLSFEWREVCLRYGREISWVFFLFCLVSCSYLRNDNNNKNNYYNNTHKAIEVYPKAIKNDFRVFPIIKKSSASNKWGGFVVTEEQLKTNTTTLTLTPTLDNVCCWKGSGCFSWTKLVHPFVCLWVRLCMPACYSVQSHRIRKTIEFILRLFVPAILSVDWDSSTFRYFFSISSPSNVNCLHCESNARFNSSHETTRIHLNSDNITVKTIKQKK